MPQLLADAVREANSVDADGNGICNADAPVERVRWLECFTGNERINDFCEATDPRGDFESNSSQGYKEYQDRLRAVALRKEGKEKGEIASLMGRPERFVQTWWKKEPKEVPRPAGVHDYLKPEFWRDIQLVRGFGKGLGIYEEILQNCSEWVQPMSDGADFKGAGYKLKYDKEGRMRPQGNQNAKDGLTPGKYTQLDKLSQKLLVTQNIDDRVLKRPGILWYPDGSSDAIEHRHEAWTALMSFGEPRILTIDKQPILLRDGDLIVFGTQRHGVPKMCTEGATFDEYGGRMSVVFFFMPTGQQAQGSEPWKAIMENDRPSRKASAMIHDAHLGATAQLQGLLSGPHAASIRHLQDLGFADKECAAALQATGFDLERAAEAAGSGLGGFDKADQITRLYARLGELQAAKAKPSATSGSSSDSTTCSSHEGLDDEELARKLQQEEQGCGGCGLHGDEAWEEMAILEQIQDLESQPDALSAEALKSQFAAYDEMIDAKDADDWDGRGDLMVREWRRLHLQIEQQEASTIYSYGCGQLREQLFFELLSLHSIRVLYDFRPAPDRSTASHFSERALEVACKARGIQYRHIALGRETAYGILKHLREDEGRNSLAELVWWARRKRTAFLGIEEDWRVDSRLAIGMVLRKAGHKVLHVRGDGGTEEHPEDVKVPDHLATEEERLRLLEKQRQAGELKRATKSAVSRSTESVAQRLAQPRKEVDVGEELRKARTQAELCRIQRRLADMSRKAEDSSDAKAGLGPKMLHVTKWVRAEAQKQREYLAAGKTKDGKEKGKAGDGSIPSYSWAGTGGTSGGNVDFGGRGVVGTTSTSSSSSAAPPPTLTGGESHAATGTSELMVECGCCNQAMPWSTLEEGDGLCPACAESVAIQAVAAAETPGLLEEESPDIADDTEPLAVWPETGGAAGYPAQLATSDPGDSGEAAVPVKSAWRSKWRGQRAAAAEAS
eukprot:TRINITY_DN44854_c0_g1_i2.p1 TRINITY_DN44854_c0_g1~~TRINITY_DN44854_c0_g1_i2.p1  ORF type:complete len:957 (+),score=282.21 TRINITY_DN44854_c0_g1_i2:71-2941(+)